SHKDCVCTYKSIQKYQNKISGPIADRIDMWVEVSEIDYKKMGENIKNESTFDIQKRVETVRKIQEERFLKHFPLSKMCRKLLDNYAEKLHLSPRVYNKLIKLARTIADLDKKKDIEELHLLEAFQYRPKIKD
ncbi:MAG: ATP-binding protein, partial [Candidatus Paceibacterota bacterium]